MPQNPEKITQSFQKILTNRPKKDREAIDIINVPEKKLACGSQIKTEIIGEMRDAIKTLHTKNEISADHYKSANAALDFYDKHVSVLPFNPNPHGALSELTAIDYSEKVEITRVKPGQLLTQMQPAYLEGQERVGNFYAPGSLPADFSDRADKSGIGVKGVEKDTTISDKSVYIGVKLKKNVLLLDQLHLQPLVHEV